MLEKLRIVFSIPELRQKIFLTLFLLAVYRIGYHVRLPILTNGNLSYSGEMQSFLDKVAVFSATDLRSLTIFGLGIAPYISASIIFQLLGTVWAPIEHQRVHPLPDLGHLRGSELGLLAVQCDCGCEFAFVESLLWFGREFAFVWLGVDDRHDYDCWLNVPNVAWRTD